MGDFSEAEAALRKRVVRIFTRLPLFGWQRRVEGWSYNELLCLESEARQRAEWWANVAAYAEARLNKQTHEAGVKRVNRVNAALRRALGFTYPKRDMRF